MSQPKMVPRHSLTVFQPHIYHFSSKKDLLQTQTKIEVYHERFSKRSPKSVSSTCFLFSLGHVCSHPSGLHHSGHVLHSPRGGLHNVREKGPCSRFGLHWQSFHDLRDRYHLFKSKDIFCSKDFFSHFFAILSFLFPYFHIHCDTSFPMWLNKNAQQYLNNLPTYAHIYTSSHLVNETLVISIIYSTVIT